MLASDAPPPAEVVEEDHELQTLGAVGPCLLDYQHGTGAGTDKAVLRTLVQTCLASLGAGLHTGRKIEIVAEVWPASRNPHLQTHDQHVREGVVLKVGVVAACLDPHGGHVRKAVREEVGVVAACLDPHGGHVRKAVREEVGVVAAFLDPHGGHVRKAVREEVGVLVACLDPHPRPQTHGDHVMNEGGAVVSCLASLEPFLLHLDMDF